MEREEAALTMGQHTRRKVAARVRVKPHPREKMCIVATREETALSLIPRIRVYHHIGVASAW